MNSLPRSVPRDVDPGLACADQRIAALDQRMAVLDAAVARGCRWCSEPVELGIDGALLHARLGLDDTTTLPYVSHIVCQAAALEQLAAASHEAVARWKVTVAGGAVLAAEHVMTKGEA